MEVEFQEEKIAPEVEQQIVQAPSLFQMVQENRENKLIYPHEPCCGNSECGICIVGDRNNPGPFLYCCMCRASAWMKNWFENCCCRCGYVIEDDSCIVCCPCPYLEYE